MYIFYATSVSCPLLHPNILLLLPITTLREYNHRCIALHFACKLKTTLYAFGRSNIARLRKKKAREKRIMNILLHLLLLFLLLLLSSKMREKKEEKSIFFYFCFFSWFGITTCSAFFPLFKNLLFFLFILFFLSLFYITGKR